MRTFYLAIFLAFSMSIYAQNETREAAPRIASESFETLLEAYKDAEVENIKGYRIQIFNGNRRDAENRRSEFIRAFPKTKAYLTYDAPEYIVQVGDFADYFNAQSKALELRRSFVSAFVVEAKINQPSFEEQRVLEKFNLLPEKKND
jgi:hypothetical protein